MSLGTRLQAARKAKGLSREALAKQIGVARQTVDNWEKDTHRPTAKQEPKLIKALNLPSTFFSGDGVIAIDPKKKTVHVPLIEWSDLRLIVAGKLDMANMRRARLVEASEGTSHDAVALEVNDDSMEPTFHSGERIIVCPATRPVENNYVIVRLVSGEHVLRRYVPRRGGAYDLVAENPDFSTITVNAATRAEIVGVVVEHHRILNR